MGMIRPFSGGVGSNLDPKVDEWSLGSCHPSTISEIDRVVFSVRYYIVLFPIRRHEYFERELIRREKEQYQYPKQQYVLESIR